MNYDNISKIAADILGFLKSFIAELADFVAGFEKKYAFEEE